MLTAAIRDVARSPRRATFLAAQSPQRYSRRILPVVIGRISPRRLLDDGRREGIHIFATLLA